MIPVETLINLILEEFTIDPHVLITGEIINYEDTLSN